MANVMIHQSNPIDPFTAVWGFGVKTNPSSPETTYNGMIILAETVSLPEGSTACAFDPSNANACYAAPFSSTLYSEVFGDEKPAAQPLHFGISHISLGACSTLSSP
jgi:hypothetical protein